MIKAFWINRPAHALSCACELQQNVIGEPDSSEKLTWQKCSHRSHSVFAFTYQGLKCSDRQWVFGQPWDEAILTPAFQGPELQIGSTPKTSRVCPRLQLSFGPRRCSAADQPSTMASFPTSSNFKPWPTWRGLSVTKLSACSSGATCTMHQIRRRIIHAVQTTTIIERRSLSVIWDGHRPT